jgi:hypothetical protein
VKAGVDEAARELDCGLLPSVAPSCPPESERVSTQVSDGPVDDGGSAGSADSAGGTPKLLEEPVHEATEARAPSKASRAPRIIVGAVVLAVAAGIAVSQIRGRQHKEVRAAVLDGGATTSEEPAPDTSTVPEVSAAVVSATVAPAAGSAPRVVPVSTPPPTIKQKGPRRGDDDPYSEVPTVGGRRNNHSYP